jgi:hypothetical protein
VAHSIHVVCVSRVRARQHDLKVGNVSNREWMREIQIEMLLLGCVVNPPKPMARFQLLFQAQRLALDLGYQIARRRRRQAVHRQTTRAAGSDQKS